MTADAVRKQFLNQAKGCDYLGSPLTARVLRLLGAAMTEDMPVGAVVLNWTGDLSRMGDALALRLAGGLHGLVLAARDSGLAALYADPAGHDDAAATDILLATLQTHAPTLLQVLQSPPQTNEVRRSVALIAAAQHLAARFGLPFTLSEMGTSAGLNLMFDRYGMVVNGIHFGPANPVLTLTPDWQGPLPPQGPVVVAGRAGVDINPLDAIADRLRILSYIWADQPDRLARTEAALDLAAAERPALHRGDAADWLETRLAMPHQGTLHLVFHTILWSYLSAASRDRIIALLEDAGARATPFAPLAHVAMENDAINDGVVLTLRLWPPGQTAVLGRVDVHGRWVRWQAD